MSTVNNSSANRTLLVFAHKEEAHAFADLPHLITGVGKVNACTALAQALSAAKLAGTPYERVLVLGTAGIVAPGFTLEQVLEITAAVQHDYELESPTLRFGGCFTTACASVTIATGDVFVRDDKQRAHISNLGAQLVDMEVYAYAQTAAVFDAQLAVYKVPSDFADSETTHQDWDTIVHEKSAQLREFYDTQLLPLL